MNRVQGQQLYPHYEFVYARRAKNR